MTTVSIAPESAVPERAVAVGLAGHGVLHTTLARRLVGTCPVQLLDAGHAGIDGCGVVVLVSDGWDPGLHRTFNAECLARAVPWLPAYVERGHAVIGPCALPGQAGCAVCAQTRRNAARQDAKEYSRLAERFACITARPQRARTRNALVRVDLAGLVASVHPFLPDPWCAACGGLPDDTEQAARIVIRAAPKASPAGYRVRSLSGAGDREQYALPGFRYQSYHHDLTLSWVWGYSFGQQRPLLVPERYAYYGMRHRDPADRSFVSENSNGCALGGCLEEAILYGLLEVAERDAFLMTWYARLPVPRVEVASLHGRTSALIIERIEHTTGYTIHVFNTHAPLYYAPEAFERLSFLVDTPRRQTFTEAFRDQHVPSEDLSADLHETIGRYLDIGLDVIVVDQTGPEHALEQFACVKVIVPGALPMVFGYDNQRIHGFDRLYRVGYQLGYHPRPLTHDELNPHPHPFP